VRPQAKDTNEYEIEVSDDVQKLPEDEGEDTSNERDERLEHQQTDAHGTSSVFAYKTLEKVNLTRCPTFRVTFDFQCGCAGSGIRFTT
jgi:hypothetical protein